jgi:spermidine synthase
MTSGATSAGSSRGICAGAGERGVAPVSPGDAVMEPGDAVMERVQGRSGELVLRRRGGHLEVILNGAFLISTENDASSRAMIAAAVPHLSDDALEVLIGGLGLGYALDEALAWPRVERVTVAEYEPTVVRWFRAHGGERAARAVAAERDGRARLVLADVADVLRARPGAFDLVSLDTDNGPEWLVREENAGLYSAAGACLVRSSLRPGGVAVFWSPDQYPAFEEVLRCAFGRVAVAGAEDMVAGRRHQYAMYVCRAAGEGPGVD